MGVPPRQQVNSPNISVIIQPPTVLLDRYPSVQVSGDFIAKDAVDEINSGYPPPLPKTDIERQIERKMRKHTAILSV